MSNDLQPWIVNHLKDYAIAHGGTMSEPLLRRENGKDKGKRLQIIKVNKGFRRVFTLN